jgi:uncharacterized protein (DUF302 family)
MRQEMTAVHCVHVSARTYDEVTASIEEQVGRIEGAAFAELVAAARDAEDFESRVRAVEGPSGFMTFFAADHGAWLGRIGIAARAKLYVLGNPLIARTMLRHDLSVGLDVPVRLIVYEEAGGCRLAYDLPSSLMAYTANAPLLEAARELDAKLIALARTVTGVEA